MKMKNYVNAIKEKLQVSGIRLRNVCAKKTAGDSHFISVLVTILIVLVIAVVFREKMMTLFSDFFSKMANQINGLYPGA